MKFLTSKQIQQADKYTIENEPIASIDLMERASRAFTDRLLEYIEVPAHVTILAGKGNNGGDGLCVARMLHEEGVAVQVIVAHFTDKGSPDFETNFERIKELDLPLIELQKEDSLPELEGTDMVIDALFGSGLNRPLEGWLADLVDQLNHVDVMVVALDMPSGLFSDKPAEGPAVKAGLTISFQVPKRVFVLPDYSEHIGEWTLVDIGLDQAFIDSLESKDELLQAEMVAPLLPDRPLFGYKNTFGHALFIAGSQGKMGAAILAARACLRAGAGLVTAHLPHNRETAFHATIPEAMVESDTSDLLWSKLPQELEQYSSIGVGPGIGVHNDTAGVLGQLLATATQPLVLDADALNLIAMNPAWRSKLPPGTIMTPHPGEFRRLAGNTNNGFEQCELARNFAKQYQVVLVLKGAFTQIALPNGLCYFNTTGNPGMATAGSGDVLTGILTALVAQGLDTEQAALLGVYLHGLAGDIAAAELGEHSLMAGDIIEYLSEAFLMLQN